MNKHHINATKTLTTQNSAQRNAPFDVFLRPLQNATVEVHTKRLDADVVNVVRLVEYDYRLLKRARKKVRKKAREQVCDEGGE